MVEQSSLTHTPTAAMSGYTVGRVVDYILQRIRSGAYVQGQQVVARNVAVSMGISVAPVREALHQLSGEGVIELFSNRSARVRQLSLSEILNALEVWEVHGGLMARLAAQRVKIRNNAERIRAVTSRIRTAREHNDIQGYFSAVIQFQETLAAITENPYVEAVRKRLHTEFWTPQFASLFPREYHNEYLAKFDLIEAAILSGNPDDAERAYASHVRWAAGVLRQSVEPR